MTVSRTDKTPQLEMGKHWENHNTREKYIGADEGTNNVITRGVDAGTRTQGTSMGDKMGDEKGGEREKGVKWGRNDVTSVHRFPLSHLFRIQISLCLTLYLGRERSGY